MRWGLAVLELARSFLKCNITLRRLGGVCIHSDRVDSVGAAAPFMLPFTFMFVLTGATSTDDLNLYQPQTDNAGATSLSLSLLVYLI